jgi:hypothetical protein
MGNLFKNKVSGEATGGNGQKYIYPGLRHDVVIEGITVGKFKTGTPYIGITMYTAEGGPTANREFKLAFTPNTADFVQNKIKHIATKVATTEEVDAIFDEANDLDGLVKDLNAILRGQHLRMKFIGEQYENANGEIKDRANIGFPVFAEAIQEGAGHPVIADADTELTFDKNNEKDFKRVKVTADAEEEVGTEVDANL